MSKWIDEVREHSIEYGSIPFWSWTDRLEEGELRRQIRNMHDMEMRGFFMHARGGLQTEYLSEEWYDCIRACIDEAKALGMEAWAYDENGWPSGFAGGKVLENPDYHAVFVERVECEEFPVADERTLGIYAFGADGVPRRVEAPVAGCARYLAIRQGTDGSYVDVMRPEIADAFIEATHVEYQKKLGDDFGGAMPGFFTDEPQYYRWKTPFSTRMDAWFLEEYGYSVLEALPALFYDFEGAKEYRYDYYRMASRKFTENFCRRVYDWAEENGIRITGHFVEERTLESQMRCCGDIMPLYEYEHIPGMDYLGRDLQSDLAAKQLGSACAQLGKTQVLSEMFACCGWDVTPRELKHIAELQYASAVNVMCQHLYPYSIRGERKRDYPAFYSEHNLWQKDMREFNRYFNHLGCMLARGQELADTLVIHPMHSAWLTFIRERSVESVETLDRDICSLMELLSGNQIPYHFGSETMMATMARVAGATISVGRCTYDRVVISACDTLDSTTVELLKQFLAGGGKVYTYGHHLPTRIDGRAADLSFLSGCEDISDAPVFRELRQSGEVVVTHCDNVESGDLRMMVRKTEGGRLIYLTNLSEKDLRGLRVAVKGCARLGRLDISTLVPSPLAGRVTDAGAEVWLDLVGSEAVILFEEDAPDFVPFEKPQAPACIDLGRDFTLTEPLTNLMTLDRAYVSLNGGAFTELRPMERIRDNLLADRFDGQLTLSFPFEVKEIPERLELILEPAGIEAVRVNGAVVTPGTEFAIDRSFRVIDLAPYVRVGENRVELSLHYWQREYVYYVLYGGVSESLRNCLVFDTEIENLYLRGSFALDTREEGFTREADHAYRYDPALGMALIRQKETVDLTNLVTDGYPFYCGAVTASTTLCYRKGDPTMLRLSGRYATAHVWVNGEKAGNVLFSEYVELKDLLCEGENVITLRLCNNYRNLLGPHHGVVAEPMSVSPKRMALEKKWNGGVCAEYDGRYAFVRYGVDL